MEELNEGGRRRRNKGRKLKWSKKMKEGGEGTESKKIKVRGR